MALYVNNKDTGTKRLIAGHTPVDNELNEQSNNPVSNKIITKEINELKKSVSDRNTKIAAAITEKGVATEPTDSADVMAENIKKIPSGSVCGIAVDVSPYTHPYGVLSNLCGIISEQEESE